ncbi:hypothetical protein D9M68_902580 [compost metagenome]
MLAELGERGLRQDQLDEQVRVADGEIELDEAGTWLAAHPDVTRQLFKTGFKRVHVRAISLGGG